VRWYAAYPLSLRNLEEMMAERGVVVDHATVHRWALKMLPVLAAVFRARKRSVDCARRQIAGIETMHMVKKGQLDGPNGEALSAADQYYSLAV
jgi:hypothetical protein